MNLTKVESASGQSHSLTINALQSFLGPFLARSKQTNGLSGPSERIAEVSDMLDSNAYRYNWQDHEIYT